MNRRHPLSRENRKRILLGLQRAADVGNVAAAEALVRLSLLNETVAKGQHDSIVGAAIATAPDRAAVA